MAIERTVETDVYCDVCGEWIMGWKSNDVGVSRAWAAEYTRRRDIFKKLYEQMTERLLER